MKFILKFVWVYVNILCDYIDGGGKKKSKISWWEKNYFNFVKNDKFVNCLLFVFVMLIFFYGSWFLILVSRFCLYMVVLYFCL